MAFKLPKLTWDLDCGPLGYPGLVVTFLLNPELGEYKPPEQPWADLRSRGDAGPVREGIKVQREAPPWEGEFYWSLARIIEAVRVPAEYTTGGREETIPIDSAQAVYELERAPGFDPQVLHWALRQYSAQRQERLRVERKN